MNPGHQNSNKLLHIDGSFQFVWNALGQIKKYVLFMSHPEKN